MALHEPIVADCSSPVFRHGAQGQDHTAVAQLSEKLAGEVLGGGHRP